MTRETLIWKIVNALHDNDTLVEQANEIHDIIQRELEDIILIQGSVID